MPKNRKARSLLVAGVMAITAAGGFLTLRAFASANEAAGWVIHTTDVLTRVDDLEAVADYPGAARVKLEEIRALTLDNLQQQENVKAIGAGRLLPDDIRAGANVLRSEERTLLLNRVVRWQDQLAHLRVVLIMLMVLIAGLAALLFILMRRHERILQKSAAEIQDDLESSAEALESVSPDIRLIREKIEAVGRKIESNLGGR